MARKFTPISLAAVAILLLRTPFCSGVTVTNIRIVNDQDPNSRQVGRLEIQVDNAGQWGGVCDDKFGQNEAIVACRMLGFTNGGQAILDGRYGFVGSFLMDDTECRGDEGNLTQCLASQQSDCTRSSDFMVGLQCNDNIGPGGGTPSPVVTTTQAASVISDNCQTTNPTVRLVGKQGVPGIGFVEIQNPNTRRWGFVCDDGWNEMAAKVVCAQLCFPTTYIAKPGIPAEHRVQPANPDVILDNTQCAGTEASLQDCPHAAWGVEDCLETDGELAGVQCVAANYEPPPPPVPDLQCANGLLVATFSRISDPDLEAKHITVFSDPACADVSKDTTTTAVSISIPVNKCGTILSGNATHVRYSNILKYDYTSQEGFITRVNTYRIILDCSYPRNDTVTQRVQPLTESVTQSAIGRFQFSMEVYRNDSFSTPEVTNPVQIPLGEYLNMAVLMTDYDDQLKLVVTDCLTTPAGDVLGNVKKVLFSNKCSQEPTLSFYPLSHDKYGFRFKPFKFVGFDLLYVHCDALVCLKSDLTQECDRTCNNEKPGTTGRRRRRRRSLALYRARLDSKAIVIYDPFAPGDDFGNTDDDDIKIVIGKDDKPMTQPPGTTAKPSWSPSILSTQSSSTPAPSSTAAWAPPPTRPLSSENLFEELTDTSKEASGEESGHKKMGTDGATSSQLCLSAFVIAVLSLCLRTL
ncbi:deleted in malignant brain tumors 1 protein [Aplysia californica]|uniref:Deleted in malignant brain tumors 1 protein n=1 Tax=Aplysia californica TaxID=6500 RepID=A0ABM0JSW4_APLCA|nr:deleted in malignant brain tumors 1 protein [Aplysia californica]